MPRVAFALFLFAAAAVAAPVPKVEKKTPSLDGEWVTTERSHNNSVIKDQWIWHIEGEKFTAFSRSGGQLRPNFGDATTTLTRPDPDKPDEVDYTYKNGPTTLVYRGRVAWDGDEWMFAFGQAGGERPAEAKAGKDVYFHRFKRDK